MGFHKKRHEQLIQVLVVYSLKSPYSHSDLGIITIIVFFFFGKQIQQAFNKHYCYYYHNVVKRVLVMFEESGSEEASKSQHIKLYYRSILVI